MFPRIAGDFIFQSQPSSQRLDLWYYARRHEMVIVSKDADFSDRIIMQTPPPRVVHLRFGNLRRKAFHARIARV